MIKLQEVANCLVCESSDSKAIQTTQTMMGEGVEQWTFRQCSDCQMVYLAPRVPVDSLDAYYTESYLPYRGPSAWGKYSKLVKSDQEKIDKKRLSTVLKYASKNTSSILDIGCGKPSFLKLVEENTGMRSVGLDFSDNGWKENTSDFEKLDLHVGSVEDMDDSMKADIITMWHYLEHDYHPKQTLQELSSKQKEGSILIIEVPNHDSYSRKKHGNFWSGYHSPRHTGLYTPETMKSLLESSGWKVLDQYSYGTLDSYTLDWMSRMERNGIDWSASMESHFVDYVVGKILRPRYYFDRIFSLGFITTIAQNNAG